MPIVNYKNTETLKNSNFYANSTIKIQKKKWTDSVLTLLFNFITFRQVLNASEVFLQPGYPMGNGPIRLKFYIRLSAGGDTTVSLERRLLTNVLQPVVQNITNTFGVQLLGTHTR